MGDIEEDEAVLHLKRALGELEVGDALPKALPPVQPKPRPQPPPAKVPKTEPAKKPEPVRLSAPVGPPVRSETPAVGPQVAPVGPQPRPQPDKQQEKQQRQQQPQATGLPQPPGQQLPQAPGQQRPVPGLPGPGLPPGVPGASPAANFFGMPAPGATGPGAQTGLPGMPPAQNLKSMPRPGLPGAPGLPPGMPAAPSLPPPGLPPAPGLPSAPPVPAGPPSGLLPGIPAQPPQQTAPAQQPPQPVRQGTVAPAQGICAPGTAAGAASAAAPGKPQSTFEIPQAKLGLVIGKQASTIAAIKQYSKAHCFVEQHTPDEDKARITVAGSATEIEKCKQTVLALVDGTLSLPTLFQLAGLPMPADVRAGGDNIAEAAAQPAARPAVAAPTPGAIPTPMGVPPMVPGVPAMPMGPAGTMSVPGMPEDRQMQQNLNDYYARMWSTYATMGPGAAANAAKGPAPQIDLGSEPAFDKEALARLAEQAAKGVTEPPPMFMPEPPPTPEPPQPAAPPPQPAPPPPSSMAMAMDTSPLADSAVQQARGAAMPPPPASSSSAPAVSMGMPQPPRKMPEFTLKGFLRPNAEQMRPKKDEDSVQKMMERLQGNVEQTKQAVAVGGVPQHNAQMRAAGFAPGGPGFMDGGGLFGAMPQSRADVEFQALIQRMQTVQSPEDVENVGREVLIRFPAFSPQQASELLQKVDSASGLQHDDFLAELCRLLIPRLKEFTSGQFTSMTSTLASWSADMRGDRKKRGGRFTELSKMFFQAASTEMSSRLMEFAPHEINCCLAAFVSVGFNEHRFFASVGRAALARHSSFAPVQLTALLAILSEMRLVHGDLFNAAATFLSARAKELRPVDIIRVLRSYAKCGVQHQGLCRAISDEVVARVKEKGFGTTFKCEDLVEISWALIVLQHYHEALFRMMLRSLERQPDITVDALIQLYEWHLALESEYKDQYSRYSIDPDNVDELVRHYKEYRKDERRCSEKQRNDVASVLKSLVDGSVHVNHRSSLGLLVDVAALRKRSSTDGFVHVDLDSNVTSVRSLDQDDVAAAQFVIEGPVALRRRILIKSGLRLVTVRESEWRELDDSKDKRRYLRSLLSGIGEIL